MNEMNSNRVNKIQPGNEHLDKVVTPTSNTTWSPANNLLVKIEENATKSCTVQYYSTAVVSFLI